MVSIVLASLAVPIVVAFVGNSYSKAQKQDELGLRYVELAVGILRTEPTKDGGALRSWAISIVDHFSPVPLSEEAKRQLEIQQLVAQFAADSNAAKKSHGEAMSAIRSTR